MNLTFVDTAGDVVWGVHVHSFTDDTPWTEYQWAFLTPDGAAGLEVSPGLDRTLSGRIEFDEIVLERIEDAGPRHLRVDCTSPIGRIRDLQQTNRGPLLAGHDYGEQFASTGIRMVRAHDYNGPFDMSRIFPDPDADVDDPASYDFEATDGLILDLYDHRLELFFRLGESWRGVPSPRMSPEKWARLACNVVRHFNQGWANGYHLGIHYWEIWNEPNGGHFWNDSDEAFAELFAAAAIAIVISDPGSGASGYELHLENPPNHFRWRVEEISNERLCDFGDCEIPVIASGDSADIDGGVLHIEMSAPAVHRITLTPEVVTRNLPESDS